MLQSKLAYSLDPQYLEGLAAQYSQDYLNAEPFPHIVIDDILPIKKNLVF
jgi:hypothetical protein